MALRIRVEVVPHGIESAAFITDEVWVGNDGTGAFQARAADGSSAYGNYDVYDLIGAPEKKDRGFDEDVTSHIEEVRNATPVGKITGIERQPEHRTEVAQKALEVVRRHRNPVPKHGKRQVGL